MNKFTLDKVFIDPQLFYNYLKEYGYKFNKEIEKHIFYNKIILNNIDIISNINKINNIFRIIKDEINIKPFIIILLSINNQNIKNIYRECLIKWNINKPEHFKNKNFKYFLEKLNKNALNLFLESIDDFINKHDYNDNNKKISENEKKKLCFFILNCIENYYYIYV